MSENLRERGSPLMFIVFKSPFRSSFWIAHRDNKLIPSPAPTDSLIGCVLLKCMSFAGLSSKRRNTFPLLLLFLIHVPGQSMFPFPVPRLSLVLDALPVHVPEKPQ